MTSATQYREGDDLDELLHALDEQHPGQVRVTSVSYPRDGGVFGFFARQRVGVHYLLDAAASATPSSAPRTPSSAPPPTPPPSAAPPELPHADNAEFAQLLLELAGRKAAESAGPAATPAAPVRPDSGRRLTLRRQLAEIGVPIDAIPEDTDETYRAIAQLVARLPEPPWPPAGSGEVLVLAGPARAARDAADALRNRMRLPEAGVWIAGCAPGGGERTIRDAWQAATVAAELRLAGDGPSIIVVGTDDEPDTPERGAWARGLVTALAPEALWVLVDAGRKPADTRAELAALGGGATALIVSGAARTGSPASVWELRLPVAVLDGRVATRGSWVALLVDKLDRLGS